VLLAAYLLPALIAICRRHHNKVPIILVNIFAGWTILGWFVAFIWSFTSPAPPQPIVINNQR
jgi:hypothetical protein